MFIYYLYNYDFLLYLISNSWVEFLLFIVVIVLLHLFISSTSVNEFYDVGYFYLKLTVDLVILW